MMRKTEHKQNATGKLVQPLKPTFLVDLTKGRNLQRATKLGFQTLVAYRTRARWPLLKEQISYSITLLNKYSSPFKKESCRSDHIVHQRSTRSA